VTTNRNNQCGHSHRDITALYQDTYRIESSRLKGWDYRAPAWYFVTIRTQNGRPYFGEVRDGVVHLAAPGVIAKSELCSLPSHYETVRIDSYVVMPNHVHSIIVIEGAHAHSPHPDIVSFRSHRRNSVQTKIPSLANIVGGYKSGVARTCHAASFRAFAWQSRFYDHILRSDRTVDAVRRYISDNPKNWDKDPDR